MLYVWGVWQVHCEQLQLSYAKCDWSASGGSRFEEKVDKTIDACLASLTQAAPELRKGEALGTL